MTTALTASAATPQYRNDAADMNTPVMQQTKNVNVRFNAPGKHLMPPPSGSANDMVTAPEGQKFENAIRSDVSLTNFMGMPQVQTGEAFIGEYILSDDGTIWIKPITTYNFAPGYIKLDKQDDGTYVAHTPQVFYDQDNYDGTHILAWATRFVLKQTADGAYFYDAEETADGSYNTDMKFTYENGELRQVDQRVTEQGLPMELLAMTDPQGNWAIYGSGCISIKALPEDMKAPELPADKEEHSVVLGYKTLDFSNGSLVTNSKKYIYAVSPSEPGTVYLNVPETWLADRWIKGTVDADNTWRFEKQYLGTYQAANMHIWFTPSTFDIVPIEQNGMTSYGMKLTQSDALVFRYDEGKVSYFSGDNDVLEINASPSSADYIVYSYAAPSVHGFPENVSDPADPWFTSFTPFMEVNNFGMMSFNLPNYDIDGNFMDTEKMYYRVFINGDETEPFTLTPEEYNTLTEPMTDVPYNFNDISFITCYNMSHNLYFYRSDVTSWGIQNVYKNGAEEKTSKVVWSESVSVSEIDAEGAEAEWYDLQGRRVENPQKGIYLKRIGSKIQKVIL